MLIRADHDRTTHSSHIGENSKHCVWLWWKQKRQLYKTSNKTLKGIHKTLIITWNRSSLLPNLRRVSTYSSRPSPFSQGTCLFLRRLRPSWAGGSDSVINGEVSAVETKKILHLWKAYINNVCYYYLSVEDSFFYQNKMEFENNYF